MQFKDYNTVGHAPGEAGSTIEHIKRSARKASPLAATTVALSMLAFNIAAFLPAGAAPAAKPAAKHPQKPVVAAKATKKPAAKAVAQAPYLPKHRSIWAVRWGAAHPAQEAAYQAQLDRRYRLRYHLPLAGVAKAVAPSHPVTKVAKAAHTTAKAVHPAVKVAKAAHPAVKVASAIHPAVKTAKAAHPAVKVAKAVHPAAKAVHPAMKVAKVAHPAPAVAKTTHPAAKAVAQVKHTAAHAPIKLAVVKHAKAKPIRFAYVWHPAKHNAKWTAHKWAVKIAAKPAHPKIAEKPATAHKAAVVKTASLPAPKAHVRSVQPAPVHIAKTTALPAHTQIAKTTAVPAHTQMRIDAIKSAVASARAKVLPVSLPIQTEPVNTGDIRQNRAAATSLQGSDSVTLDFVAADINDVLKALAVQTGANIVSSSDVKGSVTVSLADVSLEQALDMVARPSGFRYIKIGNTYLVGTPQDIASVTDTGAGSVPGVDVVPLYYANDDQMIAALKAACPNVTAMAVTSMVKTSSVEIGGLGSSSSQSNFDTKGTGADALLLVGQPGDIAAAEQVIKSVDDKLNSLASTGSTVAYHIRYAAYNNLVTILNKLIPSLVVIPGPSQGFSSGSSMASSSGGGAAGGSGGSSGGLGGSSGGSGGMGGSSSPGTSSGGGTSTSSSTSATSTTGPQILLLTGSDANITRAQEILAQVDVQPALLLFDTKVMEVSDDDERKLGLTYDFSGAATTIGEGNVVPGNITKFGVFSRTPLSDLVNIQLNALETDGKAKLLADPNISAVDGQPAQVFIGDTVNYVSSITTSTTGENVTTASVQVGVILRVTGKVDNDGFITLYIHPEVSSITGYLNVPGGGELPTVNSRYADTTVRVKDGDTIAIGGLIQDNDIESIQKVPILGNLPFFGQLFRYNDHERQHDDVVFLLKTSVMKQQS